MAQLTLFDSEDRPARARRLAEKLHGLAERNVFFGTSSWKYEGWLGEIYDKERYVERGKFSQKKFESECLREYAETFPVVGGDFSFYQFPSPSYWEKLFDETPPTLKFGLKVPEEITVPRWPGHARYGTRAGTANQGFLDNRLFHEQFTWPLERYRDRVAALIFEFGTFAKSTFPRPADFLARLDPFLASASRHFRYSVEIRNTEYLGPDYFSLLQSHNTAHVFSAWTRMPELLDQIDMPGAYTADFTVVRALLKKGAPTSKPSRRSSPTSRSRSRTPGARGDAPDRRAGLEDPPARIRLREQPARGKRTGDDRGSGRRDRR